MTDTNKPLDIAYYSDVLCVWAYVAQIRLEELKANFKEKIEITPYHVTLFGDTQKRMDDSWSEKGGYTGFSKHVLEVCSQFPHLEINYNVWKTCKPTTSGNAHLFLKAIGLLEQDSCSESGKNLEYFKLSKEVEWAIRLAFFRDARDISQMNILFDIAGQFSISKKDIEPYLNNGTAMAQFCSELAMKETYKLDGSPTYLFNNKRQKLFGNVGYKILEANVAELLSSRDEGHASWC